MRARATKHFEREFNPAPEHIQRAFEKQLGFLLRDLRHPSLRAKKYDEARDLWQARVTGSWRFYFRIDGDAYLLLRSAVTRSDEPSTAGSVLRARDVIW